MSRRAGVIIPCLLVVAAVMAGCWKKPPTPATDLEFTAVMVMQSPRSTVENRVYFTRDKQRVQVIKSRNAVTIVRLDKGVVWYLMPMFGKYVQLPVRPEYKNPLIYIPDTIEKWEEVGQETIDGHPTVKERMVIKNKGSDGQIAMYRWFATDIRWPIKAQDDKGDWTLTYKDIRLGRQDPSLFELPAGFVRIGSRRPK